MEVKKNKPLIERKFFLMRSIATGNCESEEVANKEIDQLNVQIQENLEEFMKENMPKVQEEVKAIRKEQVLDGNFKRAMANYIITLFGSNFSSDEMKGIFRQGYKIMRGHSS